jgi:hypothetical protein
MQKRNSTFLVLGSALALLVAASGSAFAVGENACENEVANLFPDASMADITATPSTPTRHGSQRVDWSVNTDNETARGFCKVTPDGNVVRVKTEYHKKYRQSSNDQYDGFYYDEHMGQWRDNNGEICHTCTPDNGFPNHGATGTGGYNPPGGDLYGIQIFPNVKRNGGDYTNFTVSSVDECARACSRDHRCQSFNYGTEKRDCWLKNNVPGGVPDNTVISGVKR